MQNGTDISPDWFIVCFAGPSEHCLMGARIKAMWDAQSNAISSRGAV